GVGHAIGRRDVGDAAVDPRVVGRHVGRAFDARVDAYARVDGEGIDAADVGKIRPARPAVAGRAADGDRAGGRSTPESAKLRVRAFAHFTPPHLLGTPPPPHVCGGVHAPHESRPPQPSG